MNKLLKIWQEFRKNHHISNWEIVVIPLILLFFLINSTYADYPDEFVNILAGKMINQFKAPYSGIFDHHMPLAWHLASFILLFSFNSYVVFRIWWAILTFAILLILAITIRKHNFELYGFYTGFFLLYPLLGVYLWFHLYLADSLAILFFSISFWLLMLQSLNKLDLRLLLWANLATTALVFSSMTFVYLAMVLYLWQFYLLFNQRKYWLKLALISALPYLLYFLYLLLVGALYDFYYYNFVYNTKLYISLPNYTRSGMFNPIKFALTLIYNFYENYFMLFIQIKDLDLFLPLRNLSAIATVVLAALLWRRSPWLTFLYILAMSFTSPRSSFIQTSEKDYQGALFLVFGLISTMLALYLLRQQDFKYKFLLDLKRIFYLAVTVYLFFTSFFLLRNTYEKWFKRYTQVMPSINDRSEIAKFFNDLLRPDEYFWLGPYEPHHVFYVKSQLPGRYATLMPQFREDEYLKKTFIAQFEKHPPKYIIYKQDASIFGTPALEFGKFFIDWLKRDYVRLEHVEGVEVAHNPEYFDLLHDLYIRKDQKKEQLQQLKNKGYLK